VVDTTVLNAPMTRVTGAIAAPGGVSGDGSVFAINHNGDNALVTLRYQLKDADFQAAEESFEAAGKRFNRGSFIVRGVARDALDRATRTLGLSAVALGAAPSVKMHPLRAARVAMVHSWTSTQTEGWWRYAFDALAVPYDYISFQDIPKLADVRAKYDVLIMAPGSGNPLAIIQGMPQWRNAIPWKNSPETPNIGTYAQTDDMRPGLGWDGLAKVQAFVREGGVLITSESSTDFAIQFGLANGVSSSTPTTRVVTGTLLRTRLADDTSPIVYGVIDNLAVMSSDGLAFGVANSRGGRGGGGGGGRGGDGGPRATGRGTPDDADVVQGRPLTTVGHADTLPTPPTVQPWQVAVPTVDQMRSPLNIIPPEQRPRVALRFADQAQLLVSGLLDGGGTIAQRPAVIDAPYERGHVVLFANNPVYRGTTVGSYFLVFNTIMNFDNLNAGRVNAAR
jgi:hypothetical protein